MVSGFVPVTRINNISSLLSCKQTGTDHNHSDNKHNRADYHSVPPDIIAAHLNLNVLL